MMMNEFINMLFAGSGIFAVKYLFHSRIQSMTSNYLGQRRGDVASLLFYVFAFFYLQNRLNHLERNDINYLINPREMSG